MRKGDGVMKRKMGLRQLVPRFWPGAACEWKNGAVSVPLPG